MLATVLRWLRHPLLSLRCWHLRERVAAWDFEIRAEQQRHADFPARMRLWTTERNVLAHRLETLERPATARTRIDFHHGPCMRPTTKGQP